ncbi:MAG: DUF1624 domain-containing protein [Deltaproteobacteria bacterium]|nr:DUF1624 domain-containing protein [Deltaproteobacteria bacterium]MBW1961996.1 DUF1624 domain-containing protein [Deltaproteobacteria bacterium]MBW2153912.1 DUF1624 domain-containing protein [Deltaproteobacteria bacterium]
MPAKDRYLMLDAVRGSAVLLMIFFHVAYDLSLFRFADIDIIQDPFWYWLPRLIVSLFLICAGVSLALVHKNGIQWHHAVKRLIKIGGWALVITLVTYVLFPENYIFFGALHCIATASLAGVFFVRRPKLSFLCGLLLLASDWVFRPTLFPLNRWLGVSPFDYLPFYPWFGVVLIGIYLESLHLHQIALKRNAVIRSLGFMGRHSLKIYLLHRPLLFGSFFLLYNLL